VTDGPATIHATCVALNRRGVLILGPSGSGKSALALQLMALGCALVSDDQTVLTPQDGTLTARAPAALKGRIEARGIGILAADAISAARIVLAVDLAQAETDRLPPERRVTIHGCSIPLVHRVESAHFPAAILQYLWAGRIA
jgi:HPr kinase/phosphorylase